MSAVISSKHATPGGSKASEKDKKNGSKSWRAHWRGETEFVFEAFVLVAIFVMAFGLRMFAVIRYESIIHEFDPWFNFRATRHLVQFGSYEFHNWFDNKSWYPLGRFVGGTVYPGLMWTAGLMHHIAHTYLNIPVHIRDVCVFTAPIFAGNTAVITYLFTKECWNSSAGLFAAFFIALVPGYVSRSVGGSYDNEAVAIFAMMLTFYLWVKSVNSGSVLWASLCSMAYFYMVAAWGGYIFLINIIPVHAFFLMFCGRYSHRLYVAYSVFYVFGFIMSMQVQFVSFKPVDAPEHLLSMAVFFIFQIYAFVNYLGSLIRNEKQQRVLMYLGAYMALAGVCLLIFLAFIGKIPGLTMRFLMLFGSKSTIAIVKSVSEHQPTSWGTYWFDEHILCFMTLAGVLLCFQRPSDAAFFAILYGVFAAYFSNIMIRIMLVVSPAMCVLGAIAVSEMMKVSFETLVRAAYSSSQPLAPPSTGSSRRRSVSKGRGSGKSVSSGTNALSIIAALLAIVAFFYYMFLFTIHCVWVTSLAYSSPSIVLQARGNKGEPIIFDDFREAYQWLYHNTEADDAVMSWWDYGYQMTGMGNKTVIVDNNTRNNTHIGTVGLAMASKEADAYPILRRLDVKYVLVVFGGLIGYSSDDINKFLWMVRISGGVFPRIVESHYYNERGQYTVDASVSDTMRKSLMYKMCYYRFDSPEAHTNGGYDRTRQTMIGHRGFKLKYLEEAYTTEHWMVRIYRVKDIDQLSLYSYDV